MKNSLFDPVKFSNLLSKEDIVLVKENIPAYTEVIDKYKNFEIHESGLHQYQFPRTQVYNIFASAIESCTQRTVKDLGLFFGRYLKKNGVNPQLGPHLDNYKPDSQHDITFTYILDYSIDWDVCVQNIRHTVVPNDIILMSGSTHAHWRPQIEFKDDDYYDIIVGHFTFEDSEDDPIPANFLEIMQQEREKYWGAWIDSKQS